MGLLKLSGVVWWLFNRVTLHQAYASSLCLSMFAVLKGHPGHLAESQAHRPQSLPMHDSLADEEDYVIVDPAPSTSASSQASRSRQAWLALVTAILPRIRR